MKKSLFIGFVLLISSVASADQNLFYCRMPLSGSYAPLNLEFVIEIDTESNSMSLMYSSGDPMFQPEPIVATEVTVTPGGLNGWPMQVVSNYVSGADNNTYIAIAKFKEGKPGHPGGYKRASVSYSSTEANTPAMELQCD